MKHDYGHVTLSKALIKKNILCVETGCAAIASAKAGLLCRKQRLSRATTCVRFANR